jgi:hypothetical protein
MPDNEHLDTHCLWRLVVYREEPKPLAVSILGDDLPFQYACEIASNLEQGLNDE